MEEGSTNGKLEEIKKEELKEEVIVEGVDKFKSDDVVDDNSVDVKEIPDGGDDSSSSSSSSDEESPDSPHDEKSVVNLEKLEDEEEEGFDSVVKSVEPTVPLSEELIPNAEVPVENIDVTGLEAKEIKEQTVPSLDENNEFSPAVVEAIAEETMEAILSEDGNIGESSEIVNLASKENVDTELQLDENSTNLSGVVDLESGKNVDNVLHKPADVPSVDTDKAVEHNIEAEAQPIISLAPRARQMTSWRSCCGLFDVLRRSDR